MNIIFVFTFRVELFAPPLTVHSIHCPEMRIVLPESFSSTQDLLPAMKALGISPNEQEVILGISDLCEILSYDCDRQLVV